MISSENNQLTMPLSFYTSYQDNPLLFHLLNVGEGLMNLLILPDGTTMLFDCNVREDDKERIIEYLSENIPSRFSDEDSDFSKWIDIFVNSHRDQDHYRGLKYINEAFSIKSIWDSGQSGEAADSDDYKYYMQLMRDLRKKYGNDVVKIPIPSLEAFAEYGNAEIYCLCSSQDYGSTSLKEAKIQHSNSIVLTINYMGRSILLTGDSDWLAWRDKIVPNFKESSLLKTNILVASHHGSRSFFTDAEENEDIDLESNPDTTYIESIKYISPSITLVSCSDYKEMHHPNKDAMKLYKEHTANERSKQVYTTYSKWDFVGFIDIYGEWTIVPYRFMAKRNTNKANFNIRCMYTNGNQRSIVNSGDSLKIGGNLEFTITSKGQLIEPIYKVTVTWEVSNGGINDHHEHQEIYYKKNDERGGSLKFHRDLSYEGKHLLRCRVKNSRKNFDITKVFIVEGYK